MDIGQPRPTSASIQQNAGNNPVVTQEADRLHHQQTTSQKIHNAEQVRISPDARDYLKREQQLAESQLRTTTRQFSNVEQSLDDYTVMSHLQRLSSSHSITSDSIHGIGMFEMEGLEPIVGVVGELSPAKQAELEARIVKDEPMMDALRKLPSKPLPPEAVQEILPALSSGSGDLQKMTEVLMRIMLQAMLDGLQTQLEDISAPASTKSASGTYELPVINSPEDPDQRQRLKASIMTVENNLADREHRRPRQDIVSSS